MEGLRVSDTARNTFGGKAVFEAQSSESEAALRSASSAGVFYRKRGP